MDVLPTTTDRRPGWVQMPGGERPSVTIVADTGWTEVNRHHRADAHRLWSGGYAGEFQVTSGAIWTELLPAGATTAPFNPRHMKPGWYIKIRDASTGTNGWDAIVTGLGATGVTEILADITPVGTPPAVGTTWLSRSTPVASVERDDVVVNTADDTTWITPMMTAPANPVGRAVGWCDRPSPSRAPPATTRRPVSVSASVPGQPPLAPPRPLARWSSPRQP